METSDECIELCKTISGCKASTWAYNPVTCTLYDADAISDDEVPGSTYIRRITPEPPTDTSDGCEKENEECKKSLTACNTRKDDMKEALDDCEKELTGCNTLNDNCKDELADCKKDRNADK